ncbi:MAG TPA: acyl-CoA dehydrogenase family protein [Polyangiaceae bacterium]|jgi:alkylation response protein AidB-like acyl-CoA dehydrogenase|nr:acyl-CoA dehydrogenase family protein [Polyangiaceae bacterium]
MYSFEPTEEQQSIIDTVRDFAKTEMRPKSMEADEKDALPEGFLQKSWDLGLAVAAIPEAYGGSGIERSAITGALLAEELGYGDVAMGIATLVPALVAYPIVDYGTEEQKKKYLPLFTGSSFPKATAALVEPSMDFDATDLTTTARKRGSSYVISGKKCLVPLGSSAELFLVFAREGGAGFENVQAFIVPRGAKGLTVGEKEKNMGVKALDTVRLTLEDVEVPADARLGGDKGIDFEKIMSFSRIALSALAVGVSRAALDHSVTYAKERTAFGEAIGQRQAVAFMIADMALEVDATRVLVWEAAWHLDKGEKGTQETYLTKMYSDKIALKVTDNAVQVMGGHGYIRENPVEGWLRHARGFTTFDGMALV